VYNKSMDTQTTFRYLIRVDGVAVWKENSSKDCCQLLIPGEFAVLRSMCERFEIPLKEANEQ